ncbi:MAG TPA: KTSC domain-containing protein [Thermoanaerobaculia bacterium]|nr:KTSC domain-containing protein [Thermoanaerobaculia bacterium]
MQRQRVDSSAIQSVGYDPEEQVMEVEFQSGSVYEYRDVPATLYESFLAASSKGRFLSRNIKGRFSSERQDS